MPKYTLTIKQGDKEVYSFEFSDLLTFKFDNVGVAHAGEYYRATWGPDFADYTTLGAALRALRMRERGFEGWPTRGRWDCTEQGDPKTFRCGGPGRIPANWK